MDWVRSRSLLVLGGLETRMKLAGHHGMFGETSKCDQYRQIVLDAIETNGHHRIPGSQDPSWFLLEAFRSGWMIYCTPRDRRIGSDP